MSYCIKCGSELEITGYDAETGRPRYFRCPKCDRIKTVEDLDFVDLDLM